MPVKYVLSAIVSILSLGAVAEAALLRFNISSICVVSCSGIGLETGDEVGGYFVLDSSLFDESEGYGSDALVDFSMTFGTLRLDMNEAAGAYFKAGPGPSTSAGQLSDGWQLNASTVAIPSNKPYNATGTGFALSGSESSRVGFATNCVTDRCKSFVSNNATNIGEFGAVSGAPHVVPLPAGGLLMLSGIGALVAGVGRRKQYRAKNNRNSFANRRRMGAMRYCKAAAR